MANFSGQTKSMKRLESRKSHSWWWDSHISPKNSRWLAENLEEIDRSVKLMLKLIEEDGESFAKKAEMYYQRRPELVSQVEEFYRMYRSLAERYDNFLGELRKNIPSDLQSQGSGVSDIGSELPSPDQKLSRRKSGPRAAGFDVFLGSGGSSSDLYQKEGDESSSITDSESESEDSSVNNYSVLSPNGVDQGMRKTIELETELREVKEKLRVLEEENNEGSLIGKGNDNFDFLARIGRYEEELKIANKKIQLSEEKITWLKIELQKYKPLETAESESLEEENAKMDKIVLESEIEVSEASEVRIGITDKEINHLDAKMQTLMQELRITKEMLQESNIEVDNLKLEKKQFIDTIKKLQEQLGTAQRDTITWKSKLNTEKRNLQATGKNC